MNGNINEVDIYLRSIKGQYLELEDKLNCYFASIQLINLLLEHQKYEEAALELEEKSFVELCSENKLYNAERNYLLAVLSINLKTIGNPVDYLFEVYNYINEFSITELSWKVLYRLAEIYFERGNYSKSEEFNTFAISVLDFIFNNIKDEKIKSIVMENPERKEVYKRLLMMKQNY
jgi:tetratricopeptide (TPR) repeat protein